MGPFRQRSRDGHGRDLRTCRREHFAETWGAWDDPGDSPIWTALNTLPKHVVSTSLTDPRWAGTTVISDDVAAAIRELKTKAGGELQVHGSGALFRWLLDNDLVDEMTLFTFPVVVGQGTRLFPDSGPDMALALIDSRATATGVTIQVYRTARGAEYGTATPDNGRVRRREEHLAQIVPEDGELLPRLGRM
jgi:dihydrofolate reductase